MSIDTGAEARLANPPGFDIDPDLLRAFERGLDPRYPERSHIPARVLGYGEISTVFAIDADSLRGLAFKRLPIFEKAEEMAAYEGIYTGYIRLLEEDAGIRSAPQGYAAFLSDTGRPVFYIIQQEAPEGAVGHHALSVLPREGAVALFRQVLRELGKAWAFSRSQAHAQIGIDGQISNWVIEGFDPANPALGNAVSLLYVDTSTPLYRIDGVEQLNPELFLRSAPSFLRWVLRWLFLADVLNRYYDPHRVVVDIIANLYKEGIPEMIPDFVRAANEFFEGEGAALEIAPINADEVRAYYREDALIWTVYLTMRRLDRTLHALLGREYPYILPGRIRR